MAAPGYVKYSVAHIPALAWAPMNSGGARHMPSTLICAGASLASSLPGYNRRLISSPESKPPMYTLARELLFKLSPETSHDLSLDQIGRASCRERVCQYV